jgi:predicted DNA-binding transcriptional regulator YafY
MQIHRLFEIVYILLDKRVTTAGELARHFEVSIRTIYRDIEVLSSANIPIYATQGKGGGITLLDNYVLNKSLLSDQEQQEILFALQGFQATEYPEIGIVLSKLSGLFNKKDYNWIEVDFSSWGNHKNRNDQFSTLKDAIIGQKIISFEYYDSFGEKSQRKVEPIKLFFKSNAWYLHAFCLKREETRTFKISRMVNIKKTAEPFTHKISDDEIEAYKEKIQDKKIAICLRFTSDGAYKAFDTFNPDSIIKNADGTFTVKTTLPGDQWLVDFILSLGSTVEVMEPANIRDQVINKLENNLKKYKKYL